MLLIDHFLLAFFRIIILWHVKLQDYLLATMSFKLPKNGHKPLKHSKSEGDVLESPQHTIQPSCDLHVQAQLFPKYNTATWMHDLYKDNPSAKLNQVVIPGSHDSATDMMNKQSPYAKFNKLHRVSQDLVYMWAKCQHHSVYDQLMDGIRYLDLRLENHPTGWKTFHGLISNCLLDVLEQIARFACNHQREIILIDFQHLVNFEFQDHVNLMEYIIKHPQLGPRLAGNHLGADGTFLDYWKVDKNIILFYTEGFQHFSHLYWRRNLGIENPWYNTPKKSVLQEKLVEGIAIRDPSKFHVTQLILTPDVMKVVSGFVFGVSSLFKLTIPSISNLIANGILQSLDHTAKKANTHLNVVIVDFYEHSSFVGTCLDINAQNLHSS